MIQGWPTTTALVLTLALLAASSAKGKEENLKVLFVGDSITAGKPTGFPDYAPVDPPTPRFKNGCYGYVEALLEATRKKQHRFNFDKHGAGGQAITKAIGVTLRQILEKRNRSINYLPDILVVQDFNIGSSPEARQGIAEAMKRIAGWAKKQPAVRLVFSTVTLETRSGTSGHSKYNMEDCAATNEVIVKTAKEIGIPLIRLDLAWQRFKEFAQGKEPIGKWLLTSRGKIFDGIHPGRMGSYFMALVMARELGIPAEHFDENAPVLGVEPAQARSIKTLVYSWTDSPALGKSPDPKSISSK